MKRNLFFTTMAVVLLIAALLITNCMEPIDTSGITKTSSDKTELLQEGKGTITLSINDPKGRSTILPAWSGLIEKYTVTLTPATGSPTVFEVVDFSTPQTKTVELGTYTVTVVGFFEAAAATECCIDCDGVDNNTACACICCGGDGSSCSSCSFKEKMPVASGSSAGVVVTSLGAQTTITLKEYLSGTGTFTWDFTNYLPSNFSGGDTAQITFVPIVTGTDPGTIDLTSNPTGSYLAITAGYYNVTLTISKTGYFDHSVNRVLHIYRNMTSAWTDTNMIEDLAPKTYTITFDGQGGTDPAPILNHPHGNTITTDPGEPTGGPSAKVWDGWYTQDGTVDWGTKWIFTASGFRVLNTMTLYGKWDDNSANLQITVNDFNVSEVVLNTSTPLTVHVSEFQYKAVGTSVNKTITITNSETLSGITWTCGGIQLGTASSLTIDFNGSLAQQAGLTQIPDPDETKEHQITVSATVDGDKPWSAFIIITVTNTTTP
ncbi:MAG: hypothetical protein FWB86_01675 [Treponema sp.]|nr:hypothetical protein [Treponema sp.]MCL2250807.1 hypothetical protein [Treponema sp.]